MAYNGHYTIRQNIMVGGPNYSFGDTVYVHPSLGGKTFGFVTGIFLSRGQNAYRLHSAGLRAFNNEDLLLNRVVLTEKYDERIQALK